MVWRATTSNHMKTSKRGGELERTLEAIHGVYRMTRRAKVHKVDPPVRIVGGGGARRIIFLENPFVDYVGAWTERNGRMLAIEAKETTEPRLDMATAKLSGTQQLALTQWRDSGALALVCWRHEGEIRLVTIAIMLAEQAAGRASVRWSRAVPLLRTEVPHDYLETADRLNL